MASYSCYIELFSFSCYLSYFFFLAVNGTLLYWFWNQKLQYFCVSLLNCMFGDKCQQFLCEILLLQKQVTEVPLELARS